MGIIKRQTIKSTVYIYAGAILGFITSALLFPEYLTPEQIGVLGLLVSYALLFGQFATLGFNGATIRYFPYFRNPDKRHHGFLFILVLVMMLGFLLFLGVFFILRPYLLESNQEKSPLFATYLNYIIPLTLFHLLFLAFDSYNRMLYNATTGTLLKEFIQRIFVLFAFLLFFMGAIAYEGFVLFYMLSFAFTTLLIIIFLIWKKEFHLKPDFSMLSRDMSHKMISLSAFSFLTGFSGFAVTRIDSIMLNEFYSAYETGIYLVAVNFGTLVIMPSRALRGIAPTLITDAFKNNDLAKVDSVYQKSTITQLIIGLYLMLGLWSNIDNVFHILPADYADGRYVILLIGLMNLVKMVSGVSDVVIGYSQYYKYNTLYTLIWLVLLVVTNLIFIPPFGMTGAAFASFLSIAIVTLLRFWFLYKKYGFQPYGVSHLLSTAIACLVYVIVLVLPDAGNYLMDIMIKGLIISTLFLPAVYFLKLSPDFNHTLEEMLKKVQGKLFSKS